MLKLLFDPENAKNLVVDENPSKDKKRQKRVYDTAVKAIDTKKRTLRAVLNALAVDRDGEVLIPSGAEFDYFLQAGGVGAYNHSTMGQNLPVVNWLELNQSPEQLEGVVQFMSKEESPLAEHLWLLYSRGKMRSFSHWFLPKAWTDDPILEGQKGRTFLAWEVLEAGPVMVPSLRQALTSERSLEPALIKAFEELTGEEFEPKQPEQKHKLIVPVTQELEPEKMDQVLEEEFGQDEETKELSEIIDLCETMNSCADMLSNLNTLHP